MEVEDISETSTVIRGRWCGHKEVPPRIISRTNQIKITFKSDDYFVAKPGFKICYSLVVSHLAVSRVAGSSQSKRASVLEDCMVSLAAWDQNTN